jgi:hypothetical protein
MMLFHFTNHLRKPVRRHRADIYLLFILLSFAAAVVCTRLFLQAAGYPQLGQGGIHIAHVLWGGLLLFVAAVLPLLIANRWVYTADAVLAGIGVGLFIDEVGKFITQTNDYFYPLAAPIIYASFLIIVMIYLRIRRSPQRSPRLEFYRALDGLEEILEHDLEPDERIELERSLSYVAGQNEQPELARLATEMLQFLSSDALQVVPDRLSVSQRTWAAWERSEARWLSQQRLKVILVVALIFLGLGALTYLLLAQQARINLSALERLLPQTIIRDVMPATGETRFFALHLGLEAVVGCLLLVAAGLLLAGQERTGVTLGWITLLFALTAVNLLVFYFDQFSAILIAIAQFATFLGLIRYRQRFLTRYDQKV